VVEGFRRMAKNKRKRNPTYARYTEPQIEGILKDVFIDGDFNSISSVAHIISGFRPLTRYIIVAKMVGYKNIEIAKRAGLKPWEITKELKRAGKMIAEDLI
jgi:hypothetical protein